MSIKELSQKPLPVLVKLAHELEPNAFTALEHVIKPNLSKYVHAMARCREDEEDAIQEVLIKVNEEITGDGYNEQEEFYGLLHTITEHTIYNMYRHLHP